MGGYMPTALDSQNAAGVTVGTALNATSVLESKGRPFVLVRQDERFLAAVAELGR